MTTLKAEVLFFVFTIYLSSELVYEQGAKDRNFKGKTLFGSNFGKFGDSDNVKIILDTTKDKNLKDDCGKTSLHEAAKNGHLQIVDMTLNTQPPHSIYTF